MKAWNSNLPKAITVRITTEQLQFINGLIGLKMFDCAPEVIRDAIDSYMKNYEVKCEMKKAI
jgi:Arc/MetJ-type ribon-helix-helix transcriptional regulator